MSAVDDAITEIDGQLAILGPEYEGLKDYARLNIHPDTMVAVQAALAVYDRRVGLLATNRDLLVRLRADGHPTLTVQAVTAAVLADLQDNQATITAALAQFTSEPAASLGLTAGAPEGKS
jgi:hypothetical protein